MAPPWEPAASSSCAQRRSRFSLPRFAHRSTSLSPPCGLTTRAAMSTANWRRSLVRHVLLGLSDDRVLSFDRSDLLEQPLLEHLDFSEALGARGIHDEVRVSCGHAPGKKPNQPAGFQVGCDERCTRQGDTEARNGGRKQQRLVAVPRSLTGVAVLQADRFEPDGPRLPLIVKKRHFEEVAGCARQPATPERRAAYRNQLLVIELDGYQPGPHAGAEPHGHVDFIACEIR